MPKVTRLPPTTIGGPRLQLGQDMVGSITSMLQAINTRNHELYRIARYNVGQYLAIMDEIADSRGLKRARLNPCRHR